MVTAGTTAVVRRRPKDRKAQIIRVSAGAFSDRGYHAVGIDEIAAEVGISGPAVYRHFPNKYALLVAAAEFIAGSLVTAAQAADDPSRPAADRLQAIIDALIETTIGLRRQGGFYRWERRYLAPDDRKRIRGSYDALRAALIEPLTDLRPELPAADAEMLAAAVLSSIGSISAHRIEMTEAALRTLLGEVCRAVLHVALPPAPVGAAPVPAVAGLPSAVKRERLLAAAIQIFGERGFYEASIEEIGAAAGMTASSVYRYHRSKAALLAAAFQRASDRVRLVISDALAESGDPGEAVDRIVDRYTALSFAAPELINLYFAEFGNLPDHDRTHLRVQQRQNVNELAHLVDQLHPGRTAARFRVHAAIGFVVDLGRLVNFDNRPAQRERLRALMMAVLAGPGQVDGIAGVAGSTGGSAVSGRSR